MVRLERGGSNDGRIITKSPLKDSAADRSEELHLESDVDVSPNSQHHTIGTQATQAAAGTHLHDGRYSGLVHNHTFDDLPEIVIPDEVIVSPTDPLISNPDLDDGTLWVDSSIPDATYQVISALWESDPVNITSTTYAHPAKWGNFFFTAPDDGSFDVLAYCDFDTNGLLNSREAQWRLRVYDESGTVVKGRVVRNTVKQVYTFTNNVVCAVEKGRTYSVALEFSLSHTNGTTFTVSLAKVRALYLPRAVFTEITVETDP